MQSEAMAPPSPRQRGWRQVDLVVTRLDGGLLYTIAASWDEGAAIFFVGYLRACFALLIAVLLLTGCGSGAVEPAVEPAANAEQGLAILPSLEQQTLAPLAVTPPFRLEPTPTQEPAPETAPLILLPTPTPSPIFLADPALGITLPLAPTSGPATAAPEPAPLAPLFVEGPTIGVTVRWPPPPAVTFAPTPDGVERMVQAPILMYHYLSTPPANADRVRRDLSVSPELFDLHLARIAQEGYTPVSLYDLVAYLNQGAPLPEKPVVITFDDGYRDNYENALPLLLKHGMVATFFIVTDFIDEERPEYLTWEMVRAMAAAGMSIESHGRNHVSLRGKNADYLVWQALGSLETIEYEVGVRPRFVSYPAGEYDRLTVEIFRSANYWGGVTTVQGATHTGDNLFELRRVRIRGTTTPDELARLLALDW